MEQRLEWLEHAVDVAFRELTAEGTYRTEDVAGLRDQVGSLREDYGADVSDLRRRLGEASIPERLEWWGAGFVGVSLVAGLPM